jgi:fructose/tagatose bisphosphate aldolase
MPIATPEIYAQMLDRAKAGRFAYPAINVTSSQTLNAALAGFAEAESDGIVQISTGGAEYLSGSSVKDMVLGAQALAEFAHHAAKAYSVNIALHTDHCPKDKLAGYMRPLVAISQERVAAGREPLFQSHMWDGSAVELEENLSIASELLAECAKAHIVMEMEIGVVGGEEDGVANEINEKLYTTPGDALRTAEVLGTGEQGRYLLAGQRQAAARHFARHPAGRRREVERRQALRPGVSRRQRISARGDPRDARLRRGEDERRHRHPVRIHPAGRRPHAAQLRRRAQGRRRGRRQEAVRPEDLGQGCRGGDDGSSGRGVSEPSIGGRGDGLLSHPSSGAC